MTAEDRRQHPSRTGPFITGDPIRDIGAVRERFIASAVGPYQQMSRIATEAGRPRVAGIVATLAALAERDALALLGHKDSLRGNSNRPLVFTDEPLRFAGSVSDVAAEIPTQDIYVVNAAAGIARALALQAAGHNIKVALGMRDPKARRYAPDDPVLVAKVEDILAMAGATNRTNIHQHQPTTGYQDWRNDAFNYDTSFLGITIRESLNFDFNTHGLEIPLGTYLTS